MKAVKIVVGLLLGLIIIAAIAVYFGLKNIDGIVKQVVEDVGTKTIGTEVALSDVNIALKDGKAQLSGLSIANPEGFSNANAFNLGEIAVDLDLKSLGKDVIVIDEVLISDIHLLAEHAGVRDINLQKLVDNLKANTGGGSSAKSEEPEGASSNIKLAVKKFTFAGGTIDVLSEQYGQNSLELPKIALTNLGSEDNGLTPEELANAAIQPLLNQAKKAVQDYVEAEVEEKLRKTIEEKLSDKVDQEQIDKLKSIFKNR